MRRYLFIFLSSLLTGLTHAAEPPHVDLEATSYELREAVEQQMKRHPEFRLLNLNEPSIDRAISIGEKLFRWVDSINASRGKDNKIRLTSPGTRRGIPINAPSRYSPRSVTAELKTAEADLPLAMSEVLFGNAPITSVNPVTDEEFSTFGRQVDRIYQTATRWMLLSPYKSSYASRQVQDIRGYYYLKSNHWDALKLSEWANLNRETQSQLRDAFYGICLNNRVRAATCRTEASQISTGDQAVQFYSQFIDAARKTYDRFFELRGARRDIEWSSVVSQEAKIPFVNPSTEAVRQFIKNNIEDEFSWVGWGLKINFVSRAPAPYVEFIPGVTPNVEGLGGNRIQMDANVSIDEYEVQWTIRHEFGHVLGLPDCYHEFFDVDADEFVNYQIDITDLMCSRAGNMNERIFLTLRSSYMR